MAPSFPQEPVVEVLGVSEGMMAIIPTIIRGGGDVGVRIQCFRNAQRGEAHFSQPAVEVGAKRLTLDSGYP